MTPSNRERHDMYTTLKLVLFGAALFLLFRGLRLGSLPKTVAGALTGVAGFAFFGLMDIYGEYLWFHSLGYPDRFFTVLFSQVSITLAGGILGWLWLHLATLPIRPQRRLFVWPPRALGALAGMAWGIGQWDTVLLYLNRVSTKTVEPILGMDTGFYFFSLPFYRAIHTLCLTLSWIGLLAILAAYLFIIDKDTIRFRFSPGESESFESELRLKGKAVRRMAGILLLVLAAGKFLARYELLHSELGAVAGAGWTDVHVRLPAYAILVLLTVAAALLLLVDPLGRRLQSRVGSLMKGTGDSTVKYVGAVGICTAVLWGAGLKVVPGAFQWLRVEPNEITYEKPYIEHNIRFTRDGFALQEVEVREFPVSVEFDEELVNKNETMLTNIRLWDYRALDDVYKQFQEIRLYYQFPDVDIDRYTLNGRYRQVMVAAREMDLSNLPEQSRTFVNRRFKYTHGNGVVMNTVSDFTSQGLPNFLIKDIPPVAEKKALEVRTPQIYYGELTKDHVVVNTREKEFDYPSGEKNVYIRYQGRGGVRLSNIWRKFLFAYKFDGTRLFLSDYPTRDSRIMFHRQIRERAARLAPFLHFDNDPYIVLWEGELYWILDAYTTSGDYPYSEPLSSAFSGDFQGINYLRNSVKTVVNAYTGEVSFYVFEAEDALIRAWRSAFPHLFKDAEQMPEGLRAHIRYPADMLLVQGLVYAKYHMTDPMVFYNQEDLWVRATEKYHQKVQPVQPYYMLWEQPGSDHAEFVLILPFTPKNKQVLIGWIAGMCDPENYGRFLAYKFPKEKRVLGPQQVETKIDQDRHLSGQLTLWDQRGSSVIRGNMLAIPVEKTLLYVEPIYLQADTAAYPELRLVALMHDDRLSYAESFDQALQGLLRDRQPPAAPGAAQRPGSMEELVQRARKALDDYLSHLGRKNYGKAAEALETLDTSLQQIHNQQ